LFPDFGMSLSSNLRQSINNSGKIGCSLPTKEVY
jgi:hypothetical protein